jgi:hypothetical protein
LSLKRLAALYESKTKLISPKQNQATRQNKLSKLISVQSENSLNEEAVDVKDKQVFEAVE